MKRWILIVALPFFLLFMEASTVVLACSGCAGCTWLDIENDINDQTLVVRGTGEMRGNGAIVFVSEYLVGEPAEPYMFVYYFGDGHINASSMGYYSGSCGSGAKFPTSEEAYYVMTRQQDGTYRINHVIDFPSPIPQFVDTSTDREVYSLSEEDFLARINANPQPPPDLRDVETMALPVTAPGIIQTQDDRLYLLPVDIETVDDLVLIADNVHNFNVVDTFVGITTDDKLILHETLSGFQWIWDHPIDVDCTVIDCIEFSDNGVVMARQVDADTVQVCELALIYPNSNYVSQPSAEKHPCIRRDVPNASYRGVGVRFSTDSHQMAIWHDGQITIYGGLSWLANLMWEENPIIITSTTLETPTEDDSTHWFAGLGVWSHDSRWLAYSDLQGLWLWDVFTQEPKLFLPTGHSGIIPYARFFSESGRYLAITIGDEHFIMDRFSDLIFPDGSIRPDERKMIRRDTVNQMPVPAKMCNLLDGECMPLNEAVPDTLIKDAYWMESHFRSNEWSPCYIALDTPTAPMALVHASIFI